MTLHGVDVSSLQNPLSTDWMQIAKAGNVFAFVRASEGFTPDGAYIRHRDGARATGLLTGADSYWRPRHTPQVLTDAFFSVTGDDPWALPPVIDLESEDAPDKLSPAALLDHVSQGIELFADRSGSRPILYIGPSFADRYLPPDHDLATKADLWLAAYLPTPLLPRGWTEYLFWQWSGSARVPGYPGMADVSRYEGTVDSLCNLAGGQ